MRRLIAGALSLRGAAPPVPEAAARAALDGAPGGSITLGPLAVAWTGAGAVVDEHGACLVDGSLDGLEPRSFAPGMAARLDGDFALFAWDAERRVGVLARDHMGARSMFWAMRGDAIFFAGEIEPLIRLLPSRPPPDSTAVVHWLASEPLPGDRTLYDGVRRVPPAHELRLAADAAPVSSRYWAPSYEEPPRETRAGAVERLRQDVLGLARRGAAGATTGIFLSGGLDSASLAALAADQADLGVRGYSGSFPTFPELDESELVEELGRRLEIPLTRIEVGGEGLLAGGLAHICRWGLPPVGWSDFWEQPLLAQAVAEGTTRMVSGDGGDEVFGVRPYLVGDLVRRGRILAARRLVRRAPGAADAPDAAALRSFFVEYGLRGAAPYPLHRLAAHRLGRRGRPWLDAASNARLRDELDRWEWKRLDGPLWWRSLAHLLCERVEARGVLDHMRRRLEWAGLDGRHPFLDRRAVELALRLPPELTFDPRVDRPLLRDALEGRLPERVRLRHGKSRFDNLVLANLRRDLTAISDLICTPGAEIGAYVDRAAVGRLVADGPGRRAGGPFVWAQEVLRLVTTEVWLREQRAPGFAAALVEEGRFSAGNLQFAAPARQPPGTFFQLAGHAHRT